MKKALIIFAFLVSAFLFGKNAYAQEYVSNSSDTYVTQTVNNGNALQQVAFPLSSLHPSFTIRSISFYVESITTSGNMNVALMNSINNVQLSQSDIKNVTSTGWNTFTFSTPYVIDNSTVASDTPAFIMIQAQAPENITLRRINNLVFNTDYNYGSPFYGSFDNTHPGNFADNYKAGQQFSGVNTPQTGQLWFTINVPGNDAVLTIDHPINNSTVSTVPVLIDGGCDSAVDLQVYNGVTYASSTSYFSSTRTCTANRYSFSPTILENGFWNITASSSSQLKGAVFYFLAQNSEPLPFPTSTNPFASTTNPFSSVSCDSESSLQIFCTFFQRLQSGRPISYFPQIAGAIWEAMSNASSSAWTPGVSFHTSAGTTTIGTIDQNTFNAVPQSFKDITRPLSAIGFVLAFVFFVWSLRHKIL